jgi:hypothetical protein
MHFLLYKRCLCRRNSWNNIWHSLKDGGGRGWSGCDWGCIGCCSVIMVDVCGVVGSSKLVLTVLVNKQNYYMSQPITGLIGVPVRFALYGVGAPWVFVVRSHTMVCGSGIGYIID